MGAWTFVNPRFDNLIGVKVARMNKIPYWLTNEAVCLYAFHLFCITGVGCSVDYLALPCLQAVSY